jgi:hypothetical protein
MGLQDDKQRVLINAKAECLRFLGTIDALMDRHAKDAHFRRYFGTTGSAEMGAVKRASMDLTRALVKVRKP